MTMTHLLPLVLASLLALPFAGAAQPLPDVVPTCGGRFASLCVGERDGLFCVIAVQSGGATDFGLVEGVCAGGAIRAPGSHQWVCARPIAGMGTLSGFYGVDATVCVAQTGSCVAFSVQERYDLFVPFHECLS